MIVPTIMRKGRHGLLAAALAGAVIAAIALSGPVARAERLSREVHIYDGQIVIDHRTNPPYLGLRASRVNLTPERRALRARRSYLMALRCSMGPGFLGPEWGRRYRPFSKRGRLRVCPERFMRGDG